MEVTQAISIITQAIDVAVANGAFKSSKDVAVVELAKDTITKYIESNETKVGAEKAPKLEKK